MEGTILDLPSFLGTEERHYLVRNNGDQVKISELLGKDVGLYFTSSHFLHCEETQDLIEAYNELSLIGTNLEVVFISGYEKEDEDFAAYFSKMPSAWLAVPYSEYETRERIARFFEYIYWSTNLVILDGDGKVLSTSAAQVMSSYSVDAYPFTLERVREIQDEMKIAEQNQTLKSILVSRSYDFLITREGERVPVTDLEGKVVALYYDGLGPDDYNEYLIYTYKKLKEQGKNFEIVLISEISEESSFKQVFADVPGIELALLNKDKMFSRLRDYFDDLSFLAVIGSDGKILQSDALEIIKEYEEDAFPFTPEWLEELAEIKKAEQEAHPLKSLLVYRELDFVMDRDGQKIPISTLVGKNIIIYYEGDQDVFPVNSILPQLLDAYHKINEKGKQFEVIFVSGEMEQSLYNEHFQEMPWLALPYNYKRIRSWMRKFNIGGPYDLVSIDPTGNIIQETFLFVVKFGMAAYPFTQERIEEFDREYEEKAKAWPEKLIHKLTDDHELEKRKETPPYTVYDCYNCYVCCLPGSGWYYYCKVCYHFLHPKCTLENDIKCLHKTNINKN